MTTQFDFELKDEVTLVHSDEHGRVIGRSDSLDYGVQYNVRYKAGDGRQVETWWPRSALAPCTQTTAAPLNVEVSIEVPEPVVTVTPVAAETSADVSSDVDVDGMPYNAEYHAKTKSFNADGTWKALRGKAPEAKAAREAFLAAGGATTPPVVEDAPVTPPMPTPTPTVVTPPAPVAAPAPAAAPAAAPVPMPPNTMTEIPTTDTVITLLTQALDQQRLAIDGLGAWYINHGVTDLENPTVQIDSNDAMRVSMADDLTALLAAPVAG